MKRHPHIATLTLLLALLSFAVSAAHAARGAAAGDSAPLLPATIDNATIDFNRVVDTPEALQNAALQALADDATGALKFDHYTVTVFETSGDDWASLLLIPTAVLDSNWQQPLAIDDPINIIATRRDNGAWYAVVKSDATLPWLQSAVPQPFMDLTPAQPEQTFLFPWTAGQYWRVSQTWHSTEAIDFFPLVQSHPPTHSAVLAMGSGTLTQLCNDGVQAYLGINHGGVTSGYMHLDAATIRAHDLNQNIPRGRFLGLLYDGEAFFEPNSYCRNIPNLQFSTPCGCGTGAHLHLSTSDRNTTVDGHNLDAVGSSRNTYVSTNVRDEGPPPPAPSVITIANVPAIIPAHTLQCGSGWLQIDGYNGAPAYLTLNTNQPTQSTNRADWTPNLPQSGRYQVAAYIPNHGPIDWGCGSVDYIISADTGDARYQITHSAGQTTVSANQGPVANDWLSLGTFHFGAGSASRVRLTDLNGETNLSRTVSFSAMRFTLQPPDTPTGLSASNGAHLDRVQLTWNPATGAAAYDIYRALPGGQFTKIGSAPAATYADTSATPGVTYHYQVRAVNPAGVSDPGPTAPGARRHALLTFLPVTSR